MYVDQYLNEEQDPKVVEKTLEKLKDMLTSGEVISYVAVQKKPAITIMPDCIVASNKRIFLCELAKLGLTTNYEIFPWKDVKEVSFKEDFFGARFTVVPLSGENLTVSHIPKVQARKLFQIANEALEKQQEQFRLQEIELKKATAPNALFNKYEDASDLPLPEELPQGNDKAPPATDDLTRRLEKLKTLFEKQLISQEEYESKKNEILSQF